MSKALARAAPLKPELRLVQAISEFEMNLSTNEKAEIHKHSQRVPKIEDIMRLTAEIDRTSSAKANERRRCYGPRVTSFLEGLHQFAGTVDIAVGGSVQNRTASGIWAVALTKYSPYIEKLSKLLMEVSRSSPLLKDLSGLYIRSKRIQDSLCEYHIVVVQLCHELCSLSKTNVFGQLWIAFSEESYKKQLELWSQAIQTEVYLETAKLTKHESKKSMAFRFSSQKHMEVQKQQQQREVRQRVLDACSKHNYRTIWKQTRKLGNTSLFIHDAAYQNWLTAKSSCTLLYSGKLGSGKSVLFANLVDDLYLRDDTDFIAAYFFCRHDTAESLESRTIIGCLARQILQHLPDNDTQWKSFGESIDSSLFDLDELIQLITTSMPKPVRFALDGVDELNLGEKQKLLKYIFNLQQKIPLLVCMSTRSSQDIFHGSKHLEKLEFGSIPQNDKDVETFVNNEIDCRLAEGMLLVSDNKLILEIKEKLVANAQGMFLWVYLQVINLCSMGSDFHIREALDNLPKGIEETYNRLLQDHNQANLQHRCGLLELIIVAYRPLRCDELCEALSVEPGAVAYDPSKLLNSINSIIRSCKGLVIVDEEEETVRLIHFSARQFLTSLAYTERLDAASAQSKISDILLTYLNSPKFETQLVPHKPRNISSAAIPAAILIRTVPMASKLIRIPRDRKNLTMVSAVNTVTCSNLRDYALKYWDKHLMATDQSDCSLKMLDMAISKGRINIHAEYAYTPLQQAVWGQYSNVVRVLLKHNVKDEDICSALLSASFLKNTEIVDMILSFFSDLGVLFRLMAAQDNTHLLGPLLPYLSEETMRRQYASIENYTFLVYAIENNAYGIVHLLLETNATDELTRVEALLHVAWRANRRYLNLLTPVISITSDDLDQRRLWRAATSDWEPSRDSQSAVVVSDLLQTGHLDMWRTHCGQINIGLSPTGYYPLVHASGRCLLKVMKVLLEYDAGIVNLIVTSTTTAINYATSKKAEALLREYGGKSWEELNAERVKDIIID